MLGPHNVVVVFVYALQHSFLSSLRLGQVEPHVQESTRWKAKDMKMDGCPPVCLWRGKQREGWGGGEGSVSIINQTESFKIKRGSNAVD